jgi:hypothetical protein
VATEADDVAIWIFDIEVLRAPLGRHDRLEDRHAVSDALLVERLDSVNARRGVEMIVVTPVLVVRVVTGRFLQVKFQSVQNTDRVEPLPWLELNLKSRHKTLRPPAKVALVVLLRTILPTVDNLRSLLVTPTMEMRFLHHLRQADPSSTAPPVKSGRSVARFPANTGAG